MKKSKALLLFVTCLVILAIVLCWGLFGGISKDNSKSYKTDEVKELLWGYKVIGQEKPKNHKNYVKIAILCHHCKPGKENRNKR